MPRRKTSRKKTSARTGASFQPMVETRRPTYTTEKSIPVVVSGGDLSAFEKTLIELRESIPGEEQRRAERFRYEELEKERKKEFSPRPTDKPVWLGPGEMGPARSLHIPVKKPKALTQVSPEDLEQIERKISEQEKDIDMALQVSENFLKAVTELMSSAELDELKARALRIRSVFEPKLREDTPLHYVDYAYAIQALAPTADATAAKITRLLKAEDAPAARYASSPDQTGGLARFKLRVPMKMVDTERKVRVARERAAQLADQLTRIRPLAERAHAAALRAIQPGATRQEKRTARDLVRALRFYMEKLDLSMPIVST